MTQAYKSFGHMVIFLTPCIERPLPMIKHGNFKDWRKSRKTYYIYMKSAQSFVILGI